MTIRQATIQDLHELSVLFDLYRIFYKKESDIEGAKAFLEARIENKESVVFVAFEGDEMVGFTQLYPLFSSTRMKKIWLLNDLFVAENHRSKGFSIALIDAAKGLAVQTKAASIMLETAKTNDIGNQLYPRTDFELESDSNFYYWTNK